MNFYKHHIGDYAQATAHLSFVEDAAYSRLIRKYYAEETPMPADLKAVQRLVGARTREERDAVDAVLQEFFVLEADGWHSKRCDEEIAKANAQAEANRLTAVNREAKRRALREHESSTTSLHEPSTNRGEGSEHESFGSREPSQTPDTRHQTPDKEKNTRTAPSTDAGRVCKTLKRTGIGDVNPGHPDLLALIEAGATEAEFSGAGQTAVDRGKGFAYALGMLKRQRAEAAETAKALHKGPMPQAPPTRGSTVDRRIATMNALTGKDRNHGHAATGNGQGSRDSADAETIDVAARVVPG